MTFTAAPPSADVLLTDGAVVTIRSVEPADEAALTALYERTDPQSLRLRFFSVSQRAGKQDVERMLRPRSGDHEAVVAVDRGTVHGVGCIERTSTPDTAEFALLVDDSHHSNGVGTLLLEHLVATARDAGYHKLSAEILVENQPMLRLLHDLGARIHEHMSQGVVDVEFSLDEKAGWGLAVEDREAAAEHASLNRILAPQSVAVVGAGRAGGIGHRILANLVNGGFTGELFAVSRSGAPACGVPGVRSLRELPRTPDLVVIAVPAASVEQVIDDCAAVGAYGAVIVSDGFAELGAEGQRQQGSLVSAARRAGMRLVGPNCLGVVNANENVRMNATFAETRPTAGHVGMASQSGGVGLALLDYLTRRQIGVSTFVSMGNKADISSNDLLMYWERDEDTKACVLYLESFGNARKFAHVARRGARGVKSHTAAAATPDVAIDALFRQAGVIRAGTLREVMDILSLVTNAPLPAGRRVGVVTNGGGPGALAADAGADAGLSLPELTESTRRKLRAILPPHAATANPVDITAGGAPETLAAAAEVLLCSSEVDAVMVVHTSLSPTDADAVAAALAAGAAKSAGKPLLGVFLGRLDVPTPLRQSGTGSVIPCFTFPEDAASALGAVASYAEWRRAPEPRPPDLPGIHRHAARTIVGDFLFDHVQGGSLDTELAISLVESYGIPVVPSLMAVTPPQAVEAAERLGYPVVVKSAMGKVLHRTDIGGVKLDLRMPEDVEAAAADIQRACGPGSALVVQPMMSGGIEIAIGIANDPTVGPITMFAAGGVSTDLLADRAFALPPLSRATVRQQIRSLRSTPLLFGYRGAQPVDIAALEDIMLRVGRLATDLPELLELDLNPVVVSVNGAVAVDVKIRLASATKGDVYRRQLSPSN